jgi:hypothetical protein
MGIQGSADNEGYTTRRVEDLPHKHRQVTAATLPLRCYVIDLAAKVFLHSLYMNTRRLELLYERALQVKSAISIPGFWTPPVDAGLCFPFFCARQLENCHTLVQPDAQTLVPR